jgi:hypothetical protein
MHLIGFPWRLRFLRSAAGGFPHGALAGAPAGQTGINVITRIMGLLLMALGLNSSLPG